jgi:hypothetical protein
MRELLPEQFRVHDDFVCATKLSHIAVENLLALSIDRFAFYSGAIYFIP